MLLLGVDLGTTSVKAVVFTATGAAVATGRRETPWTVTSGGAQTTAEHLRDATFAAIVAALDDAPAGRIVGIGIASLAESGVVLDGEDRSLVPVIAWYDRRDKRELRELKDQLGADFSATTGLPIAQQWSLTKSRWLREHHGSAIGRARLRLSVGEWIAYALGGRAVSEPSLASRTGWLRIRDRTWWPESLDYSGVSSHCLPPLADAGTDLGAVREGIHQRLTGARIAVAGHDHQAAAVGAGAWLPGDALDSCGTAEALVRTAKPGLAPDMIARLTAGGVTVGWHALPHHWCLLGATEGGRALGAVLHSLGVTDLTAGLDERARNVQPTAALTAGRIGPRIGSDTPISEITAHAAQALAIGDEAVAAMWSGTIEEVTREAQALSQLMAETAGETARYLAVGGWTASSALIAAKRRMLGHVELPEIEEAGARGAAVFAGVAAGCWENVQSSSF